MPEEYGIKYVPVEHEGNSQSSTEEADVIEKIIQELLGREYTDKDGKADDTIGMEDILVVAPYNMQVNLLQERLGDGARVGTVDKFQGQEAMVVILSMCASDVDGTPRGMEFLFSRNRLNVAISRAQALTVIVGEPCLPSIRTNSVPKTALVNIFCAITDNI